MLFFHKRSSYLFVAILITILIATRLLSVGVGSRDLFISEVITEVEEESPAKLHDLVNLTDFRYTIPSHSCSNLNDDLLGVLIITSYVGHDELRSAHRHAMPQTILSALGLVRVFLIAEIPEREQFITQNAIANEQQRFGDLLQGNFKEAYRNLSYKHVMGLRWAAWECENAKFIVKIDDDTVFDLFHLHNFLMMQIDEGSHLSSHLLAGFVLDAKKPIRNVANKWFVSESEFSGKIYPDYLSGWLYVTNPKTAQRLVAQAQKLPFMWIDDTWVTGILREPLGIPLVTLNGWFSANSQFLDCCIEDLHRWSVKCDYYVGPNDGDTRLISKFNEALAKCYDGGAEGCSARNPSQSLAMTCVGRKKHLVEEHGNAIIEALRL